MKYRLTPLGNEIFSLEGLDYFRIKLNKDESGKVTAHIGVYNDGRTDSNKKDSK